MVFPVFFVNHCDLSSISSVTFCDILIFFVNFCGLSSFSIMIYWGLSSLSFVPYRFLSVPSNASFWSFQSFVCALSCLFFPLFSPSFVPFCSFSSLFCALLWSIKFFFATCCHITILSFVTHCGLYTLLFGPIMFFRLFLMNPFVICPRVLCPIMIFPVFFVNYCSFSCYFLPSVSSNAIFPVFLLYPFMVFQSLFCGLLLSIRSF